MISVDALWLTSTVITWIVLALLWRVTHTVRDDMRKFNTSTVLHYRRRAADESMMKDAAMSRARKCKRRCTELRRALRKEPQP